MGELTVIWDDPGIMEVGPGEIECCARCAHLAQECPDEFGTFECLRFVHFTWREFHKSWREGDPVE